MRQNTRSLASNSKSSHEPRYGMMRQANSNLPELCDLPLSWSKKTPGERCIWETITRSVPFTTNVPFGVIKGISPMNTSCSLMSFTDLDPVSSSMSNTIRRRVTLSGAAYVMSRCWHSSTSYFGFSRSYLTNSRTDVSLKSLIGKTDWKTPLMPSPSCGVSPSPERRNKS